MTATEASRDADVARPGRSPSRLLRSRRSRTSRLGRSVALGASLLWISGLVMLAVCADALPLPEGRDPSLTLDEPILTGPGLGSGHLFGTDRQGLDVLSGVIHGARTSLVVGFGGVAVGMLIGAGLGVVAGYLRGWVDQVLNLVNDALLAFPPLILLLALASVVQPTVRNVVLVLGGLAVPAFFRLARANTLSYAQRNHVLAARALGARDRRILLREVVPSILASVCAYAFIVIAVLIAAEASLSFLGLSIQRPEPTWGNMISAGQSDFGQHPHLVGVPGAFLFLTVLSLNQLGDWAQSRWDPRARKI